MSDVQEKIQKTVQENKLVIYMKGTPDFPQCGFSGATIHALQSYGKPIVAVDVLADPAIREGIKQFSNWPTIPQVYVAGKFVGGCDIVMEMHKTGDLKKALDEAFG